MKKYLISGFNTVQDVKLEVGTYTLVAYVKSMHGDVYTFALWDGTDWEEFSIDVIQGQLCKVWLTFTIDKKATKFKPIANNFTEELPVYVADLQLTRGNIPVESGASPFDIDQILNDLHDEIDAIEDFTEGAFLDGLLSREEKTQLRASLDSIGSIVKSVEGSYDKLKINPFINQDRMADINRAYNNFMVAWINSNFDPKNPYDVTNKGGLKDIILWIVDGDEIVDENERVEKDRALEAFNSALYAYNLAEKEVYKDIGDEIEGVQNEIDGLENFTNKAFEDGIIDRAEAKAIEKYINTVNESFETIEASYNELMLNVLLLTVGKNTLKGWYNALLSAKDSLMDTILIAIEDGIATPAEKEAVDDAFIVYNNAMKEYQVAFEVAREAIEKERLKDVQNEIDEAKQRVTDLGEEIDNAFSDSSITNIEANSLDLLRKNLAKEVADVVAIATSISVSVVDINAKMSALNSILYTYTGKADSVYPITVTAGQRDAINTAFTNLESSLVALSNTIENKKVQSLEDYMEGAFQDGVLDEGEKQKIRAYLQGIEETMGRAESQYIKVYSDPLLIKPSDPLLFDAKTNLFNAKVNLWGRRESLINAINTALASAKLTQIQIDNVNNQLNGWSGNPSFNSFMKSFQDAIEEARRSIDEQRIKNTIIKVDVEYALGGSMTEAPTTGWKTLADPWQENMYMWSRIAAYYKGNPETPVYSNETCIAGARGIGVESITERYYHSTSSTALLGGSWGDNAPTPQPNKYIWTRSIIKYTDASVPDKYTDPIMASGFSGKTISISASATSFRTSKEGIETPSEIIVKAFASNTTITSWLYSVNGGEFKTTNKPHEVTGSGNTRTIPKSTEFDTLSIMVTDGTLEDVITINRVSDAITITETIDYYGVSASETVEPQTWHKNTIPTKTPEQYLWNYERIEYSNGDWYETEKHVIQGKDPRSIESIKNQYIYSTSDTEPPSDTANWKDTVELLGTRPANRFLWIRDYIVYSYGDDSVTEGRLVKEGADGDGITSTTIEYAKSSNGTTPPSSGWSTSLPSPTEGWYLWTRTTITYKVAITTVSYSVSHWAKDGDGIVSTTIEYAKSSSGTTIPTSGWDILIPSPTKGMYLWTRTTTVYKKSPTTVAYSTSYWAEDGINGEPPKILNGYPKTQYAIGDSKTIYPTSGWGGAIIDVTESKPYLWSRQEIKYDSGDTLYTGYLMLTNISPASYMFGEWDLRIAYTRNEKSYPIVTYLRASNRPLYYYPKKEGVIEYPQFSGSVLYQKGDIVWYENTSPQYNTPLGLYRARLGSNSSYYSPDYSSWWENVTSLYAPNGVEGQKLWEFADGVELIITEALMANFAKLDSFVFNDGKMFSQEGTLRGVAGSVEYTNKDHKPNFEVEGISGKVKMKDAEIEGKITSKEGDIGGMKISGNKLLSQDERIEIDGVSSTIALKDSNGKTKTVLKPTNIGSIASYFTGSGSFSTVVNHLAGEYSERQAGNASITITGAQDTVYDLVIPAFSVTAYALVGLTNTNGIVESYMTVSLLKDGVIIENLAEAEATAYWDDYPGPWAVTKPDGRASSVITVIGPGVYTLRIMHFSWENYQGNGSYTAKGSVTISGSMTASQVVNRSEIGNNGMVIATSAQSYTYMVDDLYQVRKGNTGFRITSSGVQKSSNMQAAIPTWNNIL